MIVAVLDTNVVVSALLQPSGVPGSIVAHWRAGDFETALSAPLLQEIGDVLRRPVIRKSAHITPAQIDEFVKLLAETSRFAGEPLEIVPIVADDPDDDIVLATALHAQADVIVSGDQHLQRLGAHQKIPILSPRQFLSVLSQ